MTMGIEQFRTLTENTQLANRRIRLDGPEGMETLRAPQSRWGRVVDWFKGIGHGGVNQEKIEANNRTRLAFYNALVKSTNVDFAKSVIEKNTGEDLNTFLNKGTGLKLSRVKTMFEISDRAHDKFRQTNARAANAYITNSLGRVLNTAKGQNSKSQLSRSQSQRSGVGAGASAEAGGNVTSPPAAAREVNPAAPRPGQSPAQNPEAAVSALNVKTVLYASGRFRTGSPRQWFEEGKDGQQFVWVEEKRDPSSVFLSDDGRKMRLQIDLNRRQILLSQGTTPFQPLYPIVSATAAVTVPLTTEQKCVDAVQGKVAWNRRGDKRWQPDTVRKLCGDTNLVGPTIECFEKELKNQGDAQRAIASCTEGRQQLQVVYVIPKGQQALPDADKALAAIMGVIQRHYFQELGATFELKSPLVSVVAIDETVEELKDLDGSTMFKRAQRLAANEYREDYEYRDNVIVFVFGGLQLGAGVGGANVAAIAAPFWRPAYDMFKRTPSDLPKVRGLHAWSHELGHAFGLMHTEDTRGCLKKFGIDLGTLASLIMQKREDRPTVYDYPFIAEEKHLLLDEAYYSNCRPLLLKRSHASRHLRHPLPAQPGSN